MENPTEIIQHCWINPKSKKLKGEFQTMKKYSKSLTHIQIFNLTFLQ